MAMMFDLLLTGAISLDVMAVSLQRPADVAARQSRRLAQLLRGAAAGSARYRRLLDGRDAATMPLAALPVVGKRELMHDFAGWVTDPQIDLDALRTFIAEPGRIAEPYLGRYIVWETSGSTGEPGIFVQDAQAMAVYDTLEALRCDPPRRLDPLALTERCAVVIATGGHFASHVTAERLRRLNPWLAPSLHVFSILQPTAALVDELNRYKPTVVATYPTAAVLLSEQAARGALRIAPREILTGGETLSPTMRDLLARTFGCVQRNHYGASEFLTLGWECRHGNMHANTDWMILEPVDAQYRPVPMGTVPHTTLLTNLANRVQPLIRYDLGDQVTLKGVGCPCGSPLPVIDVHGRCDDALHMAGRRGPVTLLPLALSTVLEDEAGVFDFQLLQRDTRTLALRLGSNVAAARPAQRRCCDVLRAFARRQGIAALRIVVEAGPPLRERSGKVRRIIALHSD